MICPVDDAMELGFWEPDALPVIPERSRLCSLSPRGLGTSQVESLTGYMSRLADAHNLSVGSMFNWDSMRYAASRLPQRLALDSHGAEKKHSVSDRASDLNGACSRTERWIETIGQLTAVHGLHRLTMMPFRHFLRESGLLRRRRAWCSRCYESDGKTGEVYDRLIWCLKSVLWCPIHGTPLSGECPKCGKSMSHLAAETLPGYSSCCGTWLGSSEEVERHCSDAQFEKYAASEVAGLLDAINSLRPAGHESRCAGTFFITNLKSYVDRLSGGIVLAFAERVKTDYQMLNGWLAGNERPSLEGLLKLSFALGASAREVLLSPEISKIDLEQVAASVGGIATTF